jgi:hypothetical protein
MRSKLLGIIVGFGFVTALVAPALACDFGKTSAKNDQATTQQTAQTEQTESAADVSTSTQ